MDGSVGLFIGFGLAVLFGAISMSLWTRLRSVESQARAARDKTNGLEASLRRLQDDVQAIRKDDELYRNFFLSTAPLSSAVRAGSKLRAIPDLLLKTIQRTFEPKQAVVLLRRPGEPSDPDAAHRLIVVAVARRTPGLELGKEIDGRRGRLGFVAETQKVMARSDFDSEPRRAQRLFSGGDLPGFASDLVGPLTYEQRTLGVIALSGPRRDSKAAKHVLRAICEIGAVALRNAETITVVKQTADTDGLTRAFNKTYMTMALGEHVIRAETQHSPVSIFLFDVDNFKHYNDTNGHGAGDELLRELARLVRNNVRQSDLFGRFGGEEFLIVLPDTDTQAAIQVAEKIRRKVAEHDFPHREKQPLGVVSISGGVASYPNHALDSSGLLREADSALYRAKAEGRNRVLVAQPTHFGAG